MRPYNSAVSIQGGFETRPYRIFFTTPSATTASLARPSTRQVTISTLYQGRGMLYQSVSKLKMACRRWLSKVGSGGYKRRPVTSRSLQIFSAK